MKNKFFTLITILTFGFIFVSCSSGGNSKSTALEDITLTTGESIICTNTTSFSVVPTDDPSVIFSTDVQTGNTTISIESGSVLVQNCTTK